MATRCSGVIHCWILSLLVFSVHGNPLNLDSCCRYVDDTFNCTSCELTTCPTHVPIDTVHLDLSHNLITELRNCFHGLHKLKSLDVSHNHIEKITQTDFADVSNLLELDLRNNFVCLSNTSLPHGVFDKVTNLQKLQLVNNKCKQGHEAYPEDILKTLPNLRSLSLPGLPNTDLGGGFAALRNLKYLTFTSHDSNLIAIGCDMLKALENSSLTHLSLRSCNIISICTQALKPLSQLEYVNFACNPSLFAIAAINAVNQMQNATLKSFIIDGCLNNLDQIIISQRTMGPKFKNLENISLRSLIGSSVRFTLDAVLRAPNLTRVEAGGNFLLYDIPQVSFLGAVLEFLRLANIFTKFPVQSLDLSHFAGFYPNFKQQFCNPALEGDEEHIFFPLHATSVETLLPAEQSVNFNFAFEGYQLLISNLPASLHYVTAEYFTFGIESVFGLDLSAHNQVWYLKLSNSKYDGPLNSLGNANQLQALFLDNCSISSMTENPLNYPNLVELHLDGNNLKSIQLGNMTKQSPFVHLKKLQILDLSRNKLTHIAHSAFVNLSHIETLKLSDNKLSSADLELSGLRKLKHLDLSGNQFSELSPNVRNALETITEGRQEALELVLTGNKFDCSCESADLIDWIKNTKIKIANQEELQCKEGSHVTSVNVRSLKIKCFMDRTRLSIILPVAAAILILTVLVVVLWKSRWRLFYWNYLVQEYLKSRNQPGDNAKRETHEVVIINAEEDRTWVLDTLVPKLEKEWSYRAFQTDKDILPGTEGEHDIIFSAIDGSSAVIFVLTPDFISDPVCKQFLHFALQAKQDAFLLFYKEPLPNLRRNHLVSRLTRTYSSLQYGTDSESQQKSWNELQDFLKKYVKSPRNVEGFDNSCYSTVDDSEFDATQKDQSGP